LVDKIGDLLAISQAPGIIRHPTERLLVNPIARPSLPDGKKLDLLDGNIESQGSELLVDLLHPGQYRRVPLTLSPGGRRDNSENEEKDNDSHHQFLLVEWFV
jgi:hypothetical protein